ncbi:MAG: DoxX family protein [Sediminibacterium sp.]|nr:DoxX family protein [Sediminibacterium sp.]
MKNIIIIRILKFVPVIIMAQTFYFKFTGAEESIKLFSKLVCGDFNAVCPNEVYMRIGTGVFEFIACVLILIPNLTYIGSILGLGLMAGAIFSHLTVIGIESQGDGGLLFYYALVAFICCLILCIINFQKYKNIYCKVFKKNCCK